MSFENIEDLYRPTPMQEGMLFHSLAEPGTGVFVDQVTAVLDGSLDVDAFRRAWGTLVHRHTALRTAFLWDGLDEPLQVVRGEVELPFDVDDWRPLTGQERETAVRETIREDRLRGFDLSTAPLLRLTLRRTGDARWWWLFTFHHAVLDGWSVRLLLRELEVLYADARGQRSSALPEPFPFTRYIAWRDQQDTEGALRIWADELSDVGEANRLDVPLPDRVTEDRGTPGEPVGPTHRQLDGALSAEATSRLMAFGRQHRLTLGTLLQGAWGILVGALSRSDDVVFGLGLSGRPPTLPGIEGAVGLFLETLPLRLRLDGEGSLMEWLRDVQRRQLALASRAPCGLTDLQRSAPLPPGEALFETLLVIENHPADLEPGSDSGSGVGLGITELDFVEQSNYPLAVLAIPGQALELRVVFDGDRFPTAYVRRLLHRYRALLETFPHHADTALRRVPLVGPGESPGAPLAEVETDLPPVPVEIAAWARRSPQRPAAILGGATLTYGELLTRADALAAELRPLGVGPGVPVGLFAERSFDMLVGILGIQRAGGAYLPLDAGYPEEHLEAVLADAGAPVVVSQDHLAERLTKGVHRVVRFDGIPENAAAAGPDPGPDDLAYLLYTSGSTGGAKGVRVTHRNLAYSTHARLGVYGAPVDRFLLLSPFAFDSSVAGIFWTLATGGALVLPAPGEERDVQALGRLIRDHRVTHTLCLPALYGVLLDEVEAEDLRSLDTVIVAGEACPPDLPAAHRRLLPDARLFNEYGPTEATVWCVVHQVDDAESGVVPIGRPIPGTGIHLLDPAGRPVPAGIAGELWVTGPGVAQGYWRRPDLDAERFAALDLPGGDLPASGDRAYRTGDLAVADDNGVLTFLGRADGQVKVRGHRIETQGVEAQLLLRPEVAEAAVKVTANQPPRLVGYVVPAPAEGKAPESEPLDVRLDRALRGALPPYLVPDGIQVLRALPRLPNGKVDLRALPEPAAGASQTDDGPPPRDEVEATVARVWGQLLGVDGVGADGHFFRLGGDSILGIRAVSQLRQEGLPVEPRDIAAHPTVAELATALRARSAAGGDPLDDADPAGDPVTGPVPLLPIQRWFLDRGIAAPHHWNLSALFEVPADFDVDAFRQALGAVLGHHDALRARFEQGGDGWRQILDSPSADIPFDVEENGADFDVCAAEVQAGFRLDAGPLLRALYVPRFGDPGRLLIAVHHLVIDAVSWSIVLADLDTAYRQSRAGEAITLPPKTASIARLAEAHLEDGGGGALDDGGTALPFDGIPPSSTEADARTWVQPVDAAPLLEAVGAGAPVDAVLTTALARALGSWIHDSGGSGPLHLDVEGHGRDPDQLQGLDLSRTVGWLTTVRTLVLDLDALEGDPPKAFREVLRILEATPRSAPAPVLFNYLGRNTAVDHDAILRPMPGAEATSRDPRNARSHPLEINASLHGPTLEVRWTYVEGQLGSETVERLGKGFEAALRGLAAEAAELGDDPSAAAVRLALERAGLDQVDDAFRLTEVQESLLAHHSRATVAGTDDARDTDGGGLLVVRASLEGPLDADHFDLAWGQTVAHHPALRSSIHWRDLPHPVQAVVPEPPFDIHHLDLRARDPEQQSRDVDTLVAEARRAGLDPELAPVWRLTLVRLGDREHLLIWVCHHLVLDGWSSMAVLGEVLGRYGCLGRGETYAPAAAPELAAVVRWSRDSAPAAEGFWRIFGAEARDVLGAPRLARGSAGGGPATGHMRRPLELPDRDVRRRAQDLGITPGALFLGCWGLALAEATGSEDATFGLVASGRSAPAAAFPDLGGLVGMLANVVPMRVERILQRSLEDAFGAVFRHQQTVQDYEHLPLPRLFAAGGVALRRSPFDSLVAYANYPAGETTGVPGPSTDLVLRKVQGDLTSAFPLTLSIEPGEPTWVDLRYAEGAFDADAVKALMDRFVALLGAAVQTPVEATVGQMIEAAGVDGPQDGELATAFAGAKPVVEAPARPRGGTGAEAPETATQAQLMRIWNDLVAVQEYGLDDNFFDLGGHSLLVPSLVLRIRVDFGVELPLGLIFQDATVRGLAAAIDAEGDGGDGPTWGPLVPIRPDGDAPPLFMIHGLGGEVGWFYNLANYLAPDLPLYGIQAPPEPQGTLEAMASRYVGEVLAVQGSGPYRLGGYCIGGGVAYEMARQLTAGGRTVELLVLIDSVPQSHAEGRGAPGPTLLARRIRRLLTKDPREMAASVADAARQAAQKLTSRLDRPNPGSGEPAPPELDDVLDMRTLPQVYHDASRRHFAAMRDYRPGPYTGDAWLLRTDDPRFDEDFGWGGLVEGHLGIERVPGRHADVLKEPHVQEVGAKLSAILTGLGDPGDDGGREGDIGGDGPP